MEEADVATPNSCLTDESVDNSDDPNIRLMSCETCTEDGCNLKINNYFTTGIESSISSFGLAGLLTEYKSMALCFIVLTVCSYRKI